MEKSESIKNIAGALVKFNGEIGKINKESENPYFKSKYAALPDILSAIQQPLINSGLTINQFPTGQHGLTTILIHAESGEYMMDTYEMTPTKNDPQGLGSCITYQRRYALGAILSLNIDNDDDGNAASAPAPPKAEQKPAAKKDEPKSAKPSQDAMDRMILAIELCEDMAAIQHLWNTGGKDFQKVPEVFAAFAKRKKAIMDNTPG